VGVCRGMQVDLGGLDERGVDWAVALHVAVQIR
jgi:hypothetical protein